MNWSFDLVTLRTALLITLSILLVVVAFRRFRHSVLRKDVPAINHAELLLLEVEYHPNRLRVLMHMPQNERLHMALLDPKYEPLHTWADSTLAQGQHELALMLPALDDGLFYFEVRSATQRTVRGFRLQQA
jgi:hypothetical protein